jgi:hypothetical protein
MANSEKKTGKNRKSLKKDGKTIGKQIVAYKFGKHMKQSW